ncbi:MAG: type I secretion system permease/ATPase, partial [Alkalinema sp. RL_2_19]|nr:type I secretion system permease/ATPase [Alkalinema sp. RL_2_19]
MLTTDQQVKFRTQADIRQYKLGEVLWSSDMPGTQILLLSGKVRLVNDEGQSILLKAGDWIGDLLQLSGYKARAAGNVEAIIWKATDWNELDSEALSRYWASQRNRYQPQSDTTPKSVSGFPFVSGVNTAAAALTMVANHLQNPVQMEWVQRQLRSQQPTNLVDAAEKTGLHLRRLETEWASF